MYVFLKEERPYGDYKNKQILSIKNFMSELVIFNLTFLCHKFRLYLAVKIFSQALFSIDLGFILSAEISHSKGCVCKINKSNFKIAEYFVAPINLHTKVF